MPAVLLPQPREQIHRIIVGLVDCDAVLGEPHMWEAHHRFHAGGVIAVQRNHPTLQKFFAALLIFAANRGERNAVRFDHRHGISFRLSFVKDGATGWKRPTVLRRGSRPSDRISEICATNRRPLMSLAAGFPRAGRRGPGEPATPGAPPGSRASSPIRAPPAERSFSIMSRCRRWRRFEVA